MKLSVATKKFTEAVRGLKGIVASKSYDKIISLHADKELILSASNDELIKSYSLDSEIEESGDFGLEYSKLLKVCGVLKSSWINIESEGSSLIIREPGKEYKLSCFEIEAGQESRGIKSDFTFKLETDKLYKALKQVEPFAAGKEASPIQQSLSFKFAAGSSGYEIAGLDGKRLGCKKVESTLSQHNTQDCNFMLTKHSIKELLKSFNKEKPLTLQVNPERGVIFKQEGIVLHSRLVDGRPPDYQGILKGCTANNRVEIKLEKFIDAVKTVNRLAEKTDGIKIGDVWLDFSEKLFTIKGYEDYGTKEEVYSSSIGVESISGFDSDFNYSLNLGFLLDSLKNLDKESVIELTFDNPKFPYLLSTTEKDGSAFQSYTMPVVFKK